MECKKPTCTPPESVNFDGQQPANFTDRPSYQQLTFFHQRQPHLPNTTTPASQFKQADIPALKSPKSLNRTHKHEVKLHLKQQQQQQKQQQILSLSDQCLKL
jgi:hypothetical protein